MILKLSKMQGIGNDFILLDDRSSAIEAQISYSELAKKLCHRHFGLGADGLIIAVHSCCLDIGFRIFNSDGSEAEMCGNGIRCFAKYCYERAVFMQKIINVETKAGTIVPLLDIDDNGVVVSVKVDMGEPVLEASSVPCTLKDKGMAVAEPLTVFGTTYDVTAVSMGNPHAVIFVDSPVDDDTFFTVGPAVEKHEAFPKKTNVEFVHVISENEISVRVWERGVGETLACGTGACACAVASVLNKKTKNKMTVRLKGGSLLLEWNQENKHVYKTGPAEFVYDTRIELEKIKNDLQQSS